MKELRDMGAVRVVLHPDGTIASVDFGPQASEAETQHEQPQGSAARDPRVVARMAAGGLARLAAIDD